jgi:exopolyphosphatase/guanosine-5'-triphosphate,3'-diphosphate pyrophosphatase
LRVAAVDLGTNTFLCLVADVVGEGASRQLQVIKDVARVVRLGEGVHQNRRFAPAALSRAAKCLDEFASVIKACGTQKVVATATSAARDVSNGEELLRLGADRGIPIQIIGGDREAELSFAGAVSGLPSKTSKNLLVVDVGGGSTELIYQPIKSAGRRTSFNVGCVRLTEMFVKGDVIAPTEIQNIYDHAFKVMKSFGQAPADVAIAVAGTPTTLACVAQGIDFDDSKVEGFIFTRPKLEELVHNLANLPLEKRKAVKGMEPLRADVIVTGGVLLLASLDAVGLNELYVSTRGLRFGAALSYESLSEPTDGA